MTEAYAKLNGQAVAAFDLHVGSDGPWFADIDLEEDAALADGAAAELVINGSTLRGTVRPEFNATFALQRKCRVVAGGDGWGKPLARKGYHNDAEVKALLVAQDAAREAGETLGTFEPSSPRLAANYARRAGLASRALEDAAGSSLWWVDYAGVTQVAAERPTAAAASDTYEVLGFDPRTRIVRLGVDGLTVGVGSIISERLDAAQTIRAFALKLEARKLTMLADCAPVEHSTGQLINLMRAIIERSTDRKLLGKYRYRVVSMAADGRVNLQAVRKDLGLPDLLTIEQWPGVAGGHAVLTGGALVTVEFLDDGDPSLPVITGYQGKQGAAFLPTSLALGGGTRDAAAVGCGVVIQVPPGTVFPGVWTEAGGTVGLPGLTLIGTIQIGGNPKVKL